MQHRKHSAVYGGDTRWGEPGVFARDVETLARRTLAVVLVLGTLAAILFWAAATPEAWASAKTSPNCESLGFPAAIPGAPARVEWNGPIAFEYDGRARNPAWAMAVVTPGVLGGEAVRRERFAADPRVASAWRATLADYQGSGFDRGHLLGAAFFGAQQDRDATFRLSNIAPQHPELNRGAWKRIEEGIRERVRGGATAAIVVLPLYPRAKANRVSVRTIGANDVWVPDRYAAAVLYFDGRRPAEMHAWIVPNAAAADETKGRTCVDQVEREAGYDLFWGLADDIENALEACGA